jgi:hypothetical protein
MTARKPTLLKQIAGTLQPCRTPEAELLASGLIGDPPEHLTDRQKELWRQTVADLPRQLLRRADVGILEAHVIARSILEVANHELATSALLVRGHHAPARARAASRPGSSKLRCGTPGARQRAVTQAPAPDRSSASHPLWAGVLGVSVDSDSALAVFRSIGRRLRSASVASDSHHAAVNAGRAARVASPA